MTKRTILLFLSAIMLLSSCGPDGLKPKAEKIELDKTALSLFVGETARLSAVTTPADMAVTYSSNHPEIATVSAEGLVTAVAEGVAVISAQSGTQSAQCAVTVQKKEEEVTAEVSLYDETTGRFYAPGKSLTYEETVQVTEDHVIIEPKLFLSLKKGGSYDVTLSFSEPLAGGKICFGETCQMIKKGETSKSFPNTPLLADSESDFYKEAGAKTPLGLGIEIPQDMIGKLYANKMKLTLHNATGTLEWQIDFKLQANK